MNIVNISCYVSLLFLAFICFLDFKRNIPKQKPALPFNIALSLFLIANTVLYIGLLPLLAGIELNFKTYHFYWGGGNNQTLFSYRSISPLIIAVLYFGFGKAKLEIGNKEFSFYSGILSIFRSMFPRSLGVSHKLDQCIDNLNNEKDKLFRTIENFQMIAETYNWQLYKDEWKEINNTKTMMEDEIEFLMDIRKRLDSRIVKQKDIKFIREKIIAQIETARVKINEKLKAYLRKIISSNVFHEKSFLEIIEYIDINKPHEIVEKSSSNYIARAFGISFLCGILLSTVFSYTLDNYRPTQGILYLVTAFFFFLSIFSFLRKFKSSMDGFSYSLMIGALGGLIGHTAYNLIAGRLTLPGNDPFSVETLVSILSLSIRGVVIGTLCAVIAFLFKNKINSVIESTFSKYLLISISGGFAVIGSAFIFSDYSDMQNSLLTEISRHFFTGAIALMGIAFVAGLFEQEPAAESHSAKEEVEVKESDKNTESQVTEERVAEKETVEKADNSIKLRKVS